MRGLGLVAVVGAVGLVGIYMIWLALRELEKPASPHFDLDAEWEDLATRGDAGYYDEPEPPRE